MEKYLEKLIGNVVVNVDTDISTVVAIHKKDSEPIDEVTSIYIQIYFKDYLLNIYNPYDLLPSGTYNLTGLIGLKIISVEESESMARLLFENAYELVVDLRDEAYNGPEAMSLFGPNDFWVVWN